MLASELGVQLGCAFEYVHSRWRFCHGFAPWFLGGVLLCVVHRIFSPDFPAWCTALLEGRLRWADASMTYPFIVAMTAGVAGPYYVALRPRSAALAYSGLLVGLSGASVFSGGRALWATDWCKAALVCGLLMLADPYLWSATQEERRSSSCPEQPGRARRAS